MCIRGYNNQFTCNMLTICFVHTRNQRGQNALKDMLQPLVVDVIADKGVKINTNPVEVYKVWVNQTESESGKTR